MFGLVVCLLQILYLLSWQFLSLFSRSAWQWWLCNWLLAFWRSFFPSSKRMLSFSVIMLLNAVWILFRFAYFWFFRVNLHYFILFSFTKRINWLRRLRQINYLRRLRLLIYNSRFVLQKKKIHFLFEKIHFGVDFSDLIFQTATGWNLSVENRIYIVLSTLEKLVSHLSIFLLCCFE